MSHTEPNESPGAVTSGCGSDDELALLLAGVAAVHAAPDLEAGLDLVADRLRPIVPFDNLALLLLDERGHELRFVFARGYPDGVAEHWRFGLGQGIVGAAAQSGEVIAASDVRKDPRYLAAVPATRCEIAIPLRVQGGVLGVLDLGRVEAAPFAPRDERILRLLGDCLASAVETRRLNQNLRDQTRLLSVVHEINRELTSILDRRRVLERVADRVRSLIDYDVFSVSLWNEERRLLEPWVWVRSEDRAHGSLRTLALGEGICGTAAALRQVIRVPNVCLDPRYVDCDPGLAVRSEMAVPLVFEERLIGVLDLASAEFDAFSREHEQLLATVASTLAIALANAELVETLRERQQRLDEDLSTARKVQRQLLPKATPWIRGVQVAAANEPAQHLGGDFYDFFRYGEGRIAVAVGDVAGKATSAALYAALTVGILREFASHSQPSPAEMLTALNDKLLELEVERRFVAMAFAVLDAGSRRLSLASAGIPYPLLVRGGDVRELEVGGLPLGQLRRPVYQELELPLEASDTVVFVSDGIEEALDRERKPFGSEGTRATLRRLAGRCVAEIAEGLLGAVQVHAGSSVTSDDRTAVVLRLCDGDCQ